MLWRSSALIGSGNRATDSSIGGIADLLIDDTNWTVRWVVANSGTWLPGRKVLLPPSALGRSDGPDAIPPEFPVGLTRRQVEDSPGIEADAPVSRQLESDAYGYYGWTPYWDLGLVPPVGAAAAVPLPMVGRLRNPPGGTEAPSGGPHLHSAKEVTGYHVRATDDEIGHVKEFLVEDDSWAVRYVVVDTRNWWPSRKVLVTPRWFREIDCGERRVHVDLTCAQVETSLECDPAAAVERTCEEQLHRH